MTHARSLTHVATIAGALTASGVDDVLVTSDQLEVPNALEAGVTAVCVLPPRRDFPTYTIEDTVWTVLVAAGPIQDTPTAWESIDAVTEALRIPLELTSAEPAAYQSPHGGEFPAYTLTFTE